MSLWKSHPSTSTLLKVNNMHRWIWCSSSWIADSTVLNLLKDILKNNWTKDLTILLVGRVKIQKKRETSTFSWWKMWFPRNWIDRYSALSCWNSSEARWSNWETIFFGRPYGTNFQHSNAKWLVNKISQKCSWLRISWFSKIFRKKYIIKILRDL